MVQLAHRTLSAACEYDGTDRVSFLTTICDQEYIHIGEHFTMFSFSDDSRIMLDHETNSMKIIG